MKQDRCVQCKKCTADDKTQSGSESNDPGGQRASDVHTSKFYLPDPRIDMPNICPFTEWHLQSRNKSTEKYLQHSTFTQLNVIWITTPLQKWLNIIGLTQSYWLVTLAIMSSSHSLTPQKCSTLLPTQGLQSPNVTMPLVPSHPSCHSTNFCSPCQAPLPDWWPWCSKCGL